jgi:hypothetical protein
MGWLSRLIGRGPAVALRRPVRLELEVLEGRDVPSNWGPWESLGGPATQVVALNGPNGPLEVFAIGTGGSVVYRAEQSGVWGPWQSLGGVALQLAVTENATNHYADVFVVGANHAVYWNAQSQSGWSGWVNLGGYATQVAADLADNPTMISPLGEDEEELFAIGTGGAVYHRALPRGGSWSGWENLGGVALKIAAPQSGTNLGGWENLGGAPEVVAIGLDHSLWDRVESGGSPWHPWQSLGGYATDLGVGRSAFDEGLYVIGSDSSVWRRVNTSNGTLPSWGAWQSLGGGATQIAVSGGQNNTDVFVIGGGGAVWHGNEVHGMTSWSGWEDLGRVASGISGCTNGADQIDLFAIGASDSAVYHRSGS